LAKEVEVVPTELELLLTIDGPRPFYSRNDEDHFFGWLQSISGIEKVTGVGETLEITVRRPLERDSLHDLIALLTRYGLDRRPLKPLCDEQPGDYFQGQGTYWHSAVYG
jgi:hypothetical protein